MIKGFIQYVGVMLKGKMKYLEKEPTVAIAGEWFTAHGTGMNLGF